jgi:hypothetical protein
MNAHVSRRKTTTWILTAATAIAIGSGCGGGCGGCGFEPIPGGFPSEERQANAVQVRVSDTGLAAITENPAALISGFGSGPAPGVVSFGGIDVNLNRLTNDTPRLELAPVQGASRLGFTMRARLITPTPMQVDVPIVGTCDLTINTTTGCGAVPNPPNPNDNNHCDVTITGNINFTQEPNPIATTRLVVANVGIANLTDDDIELDGNIGCQLANGALSFASGFLVDQFVGQIEDTINDQVCKSCPGGTVDECGPFATACTDNVCMKANDQCLQELGLSGRARGSSLFASLSPGTTGAIDLYEVAGGYASTNSGGIALGMLGGIVPGGTARDRCGPPGTAPANATITQSPFFQGNTRPDTNTAFDVAFGVHKSQLADFAYAGYDGGLLCLTISSATVSQLTTDTISLLSRSLGNLNEGNAPVAIGLRPQSAPAIVLGRNTFIDDGQGNVTLDEPLIDLTFTGMEIDFFAAVDDQYIRVFTVVADVHFPIGLQVTGMGELQPVIGNPDDAFTNLSVKNSEALTESPADIAELFPAILNLALPQLSGGLSPIALPDLGGLQLSVTDVTAVPTNVGGTDPDFLAIFANLAAGTAQKPVTTSAEVTDVYHPPAGDARSPRTWRRARPPSVTLALAATATGRDFSAIPGEGGAIRRGDVQYSWKTDGGTWSAWSTNPNPTLTAPAFWLPGTHTIEVRARQTNRPETIDLTPVTLVVELGANSGLKPRVAPFHGSPGEGGGCDCKTSNDPLSAAPFVFIMLGLMIPFRRLRKKLRRPASRAARILGTVVLLAAIATLPACSCGSDYCGDSDCLDGDIPNGAIGRWTSIAADEQRVLVATYDQGLGDVVVADVTSPDAFVLTAVDGIPTDVTPTHAEDSYRKGIEEPGPDVGAWTSIAMQGGLGRVSYQDRDARALRFAFERSANAWTSMQVDVGSGDEEVGRYTSTVLDANGRPAIAYIALGIDDGAGKRMTELRLARASANAPNENEWVSNVIAQGVGTCAGLCAAGEACIAGMDGPTCTAITTDCTATCGDTEACIAGVCTEAAPDPTVSDIATGTGLFVDLVILPDGRLAAVYYDRNARELRIAVENGAGTSVFTETTLDGGGPTDRGMWASAVVDSAGTVHISYQDALGDQLFYTTFNGAPGTPELVDDGQRPNDRTHPVGAASSIFLVSDQPQIAYQDGLTADVYVAARSGGVWSTQGIAISPLLDGFSIAATTGHGRPYLAWDRLDPAQEPPNGLFVQTR